MATKCPQGKAWDSQMKRCRPVKMMKEVKAPGKASAEGKLIKKLTEKGYVSQKAIDAAAPMYRQYKALKKKGMTGDQATATINFTQSLPIKPKKQEGGPVATSGRMTRLGKKIAKKTDAGKTVSEGLQKRYDKATDKVIIKQLKKSTKQKMAYGGIAKANNGISTGSATAPLTEAEKKKLQTTWEQRNKRPLPAGSELVASSDNFRTGAGGYSVYIKPVKKSKIGGAKMSRGGSAVKKMNMGGPGDGTTVPVGTRVNDGRVWNGKGYDPAPAGTPAVKPKTPVNTTPVATPGTVMSDGRIWDGKRYITPLPGSKNGGAKMAKGGMTKAKKFAALAPPYNKATAADRIAGATKRKRAKKK